MHRSGTSLTASMLKAAGVNIGKELIGPGNGNQLGHFEDIDLCSLHCDILESQGIHKDGWTTHSQVHVSRQFRAQAKKLYNQRQQTDYIWGWKDPRTALFLQFWKEIITDAKFVFVYRQPHQVVASLFQRGDYVFNHRPQLAVESWIAYNQAILAFYQQNASDCFLFNIDNFRDREKAILQQLCKKLGLPLNKLCCEVYQPGELHQPTEQMQTSTQFYEYSSQIYSLYQALEKAADLPIHKNINATLMASMA